MNKDLTKSDLEGLRKRRRVYVKVQAAVRNGDLIRPLDCERCGRIPPPMSDGKAAIQGHHYIGYDHPLEVEWLCVPCHLTEKINHQLLKTHCPSGHEYSGHNLLRKAKGRWCRECSRLSSQRRRDRNRERATFQIGS